MSDLTLYLTGEVRTLRSIIRTMVEGIDESDILTTHGGDRFALDPEQAVVVRTALTQTGGSGDAG